MKRAILTLSLVLFGGLSALAQTSSTINGKVTDGNGDGLPGVVVVLESEQMAFDVAEKLSEVTSRLGINYIFKASFG